MGEKLLQLLHRLEGHGEEITPRSRVISLQSSSGFSINQMLRKQRQKLAKHWLKLDPTQLEKEYKANLGKVHQELLQSTLRCEPFTAEENAWINQLIQTAQNSSSKPQKTAILLVLMLYYYPHQWPLPEKTIPIPNWFLKDYIRYKLDPPPLFRQPGETEVYCTYLQGVVHFLHTTILNQPQSKVWQEIAVVFIQHINLVRIYFSEANLRSIFQETAEIVEFGLRLQGCQLDYTFPPRPPHRQKIRLGIFKEHFSPHTETYMVVPILEHLDRDQFELILYTSRDKHTTLEAYCQSRADRWIHLPQDLMTQVRMIRSDDLDLFFMATNVGAKAHPATALAHHRLGRVQIPSVSSPVTTGIRTMDYYISGTLTEPVSNAQAHYREQLLLLEGSAHCVNYYVVPTPEVLAQPSRSELGIDPAATVFTSGAVFLKITSEVRQAWIQILAAVPNSILLLYPFNPNWSRSTSVGQVFVDSLRSILIEQGIELNRCVVLDIMPNREEVKACLRLADIYLDAFPYAGMTSITDPLEVGIPVLTVEGNAFRSRQGAALLRSLQLEDLIAKDPDAYIQLAIDLGKDAKLRQQWSNRIRAAMETKPEFMDSQSYAAKIGSLLRGVVEKAHISLQ
jgi:predicted O-linked N-acetylglucosamine transferase (SPINDLY family)